MKPYRRRDMPFEKKPEDIYTELVTAKSEHPDDPNLCHIDYDTNTIWIMVDVGKLLSFWSPDYIFRYMTPKEINDWLTECFESKK
jgi:hypothetical protein